MESTTSPPRSTEHAEPTVAVTQPDPADASAAAMPATLPPVSVEGRSFARVPVRTHQVGFGDDLTSIVRTYVAPVFRQGDWIALSEKVVSVSQDNARHISTVKARWLAKLIVKGVKKYPNDIAWSLPEKMQVAIDMAGYPRMMLATVLGAIGKPFGIRGVFWMIAGRVAEIDGFNPAAMYPYTEYAILPPREPERYVQEMEDRLGYPTAIIDGNNIDVKIIAMSRRVPVDKSTARLILLDNPMGQDDEMTPIILVRAATDIGSTDEGSGSTGADGVAS
jgi:hypothetical protein